MKVYAEYFEENGLSFRTNTILQFGDSWKLIGILYWQILVAQDL